MTHFAATFEFGLKVLAMLMFARHSAMRVLWKEVHGYLHALAVQGFSGILIRSKRKPPRFPGAAFVIRW